MNEDKPVTVSIVGTGTGDGGGVAPTPSGTVLETPGQQPNLLINVVTPTVAIVVRFVNTFLTSFVGMLTAAGIGGSEIFGAADLVGVMKVAAWASLAVAGVGFGKNLITVFGRLEGKYPLGTGTI